LVTFSGEAEKVTARRAGALQREAAKLRPNYKHRTLRRSSAVAPKQKQNKAAKQTPGGRLSPLRPTKNPAAPATRDDEGIVPYKCKALKKAKIQPNPAPCAAGQRLHQNKKPNQTAGDRGRSPLHPPKVPPAIA
jgi:hypothetical protein